MKGDNQRKRSSHLVLHPRHTENPNSCRALPKTFLTMISSQDSFSLYQHFVEDDAAEQHGAPPWDLLSSLPYLEQLNQAIHRALREGVALLSKYFSLMLEDSQYQPGHRCAWQRPAIWDCEHIQPRIRQLQALFQTTSQTRDLEQFLSVF
jgi:hypothetical protein